LTDAATLSGGFSPTGTITFTLHQGSTLLDTEMVAVTGNGTYTTPTGFTLATTGTVTGIYQWDATYNGDTNNNTVSDNNATDEQVTISVASPTITTAPNPTTVTLAATAAPILTDAATLSGGFNPTGTITFTLFHNGGPTPVDTETVAVSGNGTYTTPTGFTLPTTGTVTGAYQWDATYNGDTNNNTVSDNNAANEEVTVGAASPTISTVPSPTTVTLGATSVTLKDMAVLAGGFSPTGTITFTLHQGSTLVDTEMVAVSGNSTYTTPTGFTLPTTGTVTGTYQWDATYNGDTNNNSVSDNNATNEQVTVSAASPTVSTAPDPTTVSLGTTPVTLKDMAILVGGFSPTGTITFTLHQGSTLLDTETVPVAGNGMYTTPTGFTLPTSGTVTGTYQWDASYSGDTNNNTVSDNNAANEQVTVSTASPTITTAPDPTTVTLGATAPPILTDAATLSGGFSPTGTITFTLHQGSALVDTEMVAVTGDGTYTTPTWFTLSTTGTVTGTYQWDATYSGDVNNTPAGDTGSLSEQVTVRAASPTLGTIPNPSTVTLGPNVVTLTDTATLSGGFNPTGTITFTLFHNGGPTPVDTETVTVSGNGAYTTPTGFTLPSGGTATGTYQWDAAYSSDANNNGVSDTGSVAEQVTVDVANPTLGTTPRPTTVTLGANAVTLTDTATLEGGFNPTGTITFTLFHNGGPTPVDTETVAVTGNGTYPTPTGFTLPATGTVTGTYQWDATYNGDTNNNTASDDNAVSEQVTVSAASPTITTTPIPTSAPVGQTLQDSAELTGGYQPTGTITFRLYAPGVDPAVGPATYTETVTGLNGNGGYRTTVGFASNAIGVWHWVATYGGDSNNGTVSSGPLDEPVAVPAAGTTLTTAPNPTTVTLGPNAVTLTDKATLAGGFNPTGMITFTLFHNGGPTPVDTETVTVNGNGTYPTPIGFTLPATGMVTGTYQWDASYSGDANNTPASDTGSAAERVTVAAASPTLGTTPNPTTVTLDANAVTLTDTATLEGGFNPTGTITFTLFHNGALTPVDTETVTVNGNGTYPTPTGFPLPSSGTATGTYQWDAIYSSDANNNGVSDTGSAAERVTVNIANPTLRTIPNPTTVTLGATAVTLTDTATLASGFNPTGTITFTLFHNGGPTPVDTETVTVNGNGTYPTPTGFTLSTSGMVTGTYQWDATYSGDLNNNTASDNDATNEQVTVNAAGPTLSTTPTPAAVPLGATPVTLTDSATLAGGFRPTGTITFTLFQNGGTTPVDTETVTVNGNGAYATPTGFTLPTTSTVTGTYQWDAIYNGDTNNNTVSDNNAANERVTVSAANPSLTTTPTPATVTLGTTPVTLTDSATLAGGYSPTGSIIFTLFHNGGTTPVDTEVVTVNGNGAYKTPAGFTLPTSGTVTGTYQWDASYNGDTNNNAASDNSVANERVTISAASPTITTTPSPVTVTLGATPVTLTDSATLAGGYAPTGIITFTLFHNGGTTPVDTETVAVIGNGTYTTRTGFKLPGSGAATGTYQWDATYSGDTNNNTVSDNNAADEQVTVSAASPTLNTTPTPAAVTLGTTPVTLTDRATLAGGFSPTGTIIFTLFHNGGTTPVDTETVTVTGNGAFTTPTGFTLPTTGTVTGTYQWDATYNGDTNNNTVSDNNASNEQVTVSTASPTLTTTPTPATITLGTAAAALTDAAVLADGFSPTGTITFTLFQNGGATPVDIETVVVSGNGTYTTPTGFTLPTTGPVTGTYQWDATYSGDTNNNSAVDTGSATEQVTVSAASPTLGTTPNPTTVTLGANAVTLTDTATLESGFHPTGTITFTLFHNGGPTPVDTETVTVNGNGAYTTPIGFTLPATGTATGIYQWDATYSGDANNNTVSDTGSVAEQVTVNIASPTLGTTPNPTTVTLGANAVTLTDTATLENGFNPTGTITFTLFHNGGTTPLDTETVPVNGNGTYPTPTGFPLPATVTVTGMYQWDATYSGDTNNNTSTDTGSVAEQVTVNIAGPSLSTTPNSTTVTLGTNAVTLTDTATLTGGFHPTGTITFTLFHNGGTTPVDTESVAVTGNGSYKTPTGFTLAITGTVTGTYQWDATYSGDANNNNTSDNNAANEQVTVSAASPTLRTTPNPTTVPLDANAVTLTDTATLEGGFHPTGTITFTLFHNGGPTPVDTETVTVNGNGTYTTPTGFTLPSGGAAAGTYQWDATFSGDTNNNSVSDNNAADERVTVHVANPTLGTIPNPTTVTLGANAVTLTDTATLEGGFNPTGTITFTLFQNGGTTPVDTETVPVNGNGTYPTPTGFPLPATVTVTGTYQWDATYSGDTNNSSASDTGSVAEQVTVNIASPTLGTIPNPTIVTLGANVATLADTATLESGFHPTGTITFNLFYNGGATPVDTETVTVNGNGTYPTPTGFTLPTSGTVTGSYQWDATYSGDPNNNTASDNNAVSEEVTVSAASPTITTTPSPTTAPVGTRLQDTADLTGGYHPTGAITFRLYGPGVDPAVDPATYTETVSAVSGNGTYDTTTGFVANLTGVWHWVATYDGDSNNATVSSGPRDEPVAVPAAGTTLTTAPIPRAVTLGPNAVTLTDVATLAGGANPTGTLTFTLFHNGGTTPVDTETVTVNGNGTYPTPIGFTLPATGTVTGTYQWDATYSGDANNTPASDTGSLAEQVTVNIASPTLGTIPNPTTVTLDANAVTLTDTATLERGFNPTGTITFTLFYNGGPTPVDTETVNVSGNGTYTTPTGFTLPSSGTAIGSYQWDATYSSDANNNGVSDTGSAAEQVTVNIASPTLGTIPNPTTVTLGANAVILTDTAALESGFNPTGTITFTLFYNGGPTPVDTETVTVNGNGTYRTPIGFPLPSSGTVTGSYQWDATYSGNTNNNTASDTGSVAEQVTVNIASPTLSTTPNPATITLGANAVTLTDTATLAGGFNPTGTITFTLFHNGGATPVDTEMVTVNGNGPYPTPIGFPLPTSGTATGTYQWAATYSGDGNNNAVSDTNAVDEQVTVHTADPTLSTTPNPTTVTLGPNAVTLTDTATLEDGFNPTGTITFTLFHDGGTTPVFTDTVTVNNGNGPYTSTGFLLSGTATGTYQWDAIYSGDVNNNGASDTGSAAEQVTVNAAGPTLSTTPNPTTVTLGANAVTLTDTATLDGGFNSTGTITFTLFHNGGPTPVDTETVTVNGNGTYPTPIGFTLPTSGTVTGTYQWDATYSGDANNTPASDAGSVAEQVTVNIASPTLSTTPNPTTVTLDANAVTLTDTATLEGGFNPTGTITFTLFHNGGTTPVDTEVVTVNGNGTYKTPAGFTLPTTGTVTGTYQWGTSYNGNTNNNVVSDNNAANERVTISAASPSLTTTPTPAAVTLGTTPVTLTDSATLAGGYSPTGIITFTLFHNGGTTPVDTEVVTVNGNGAYKTPAGFTLPTSGTVTGTYQWDASYNGDTNNNAVSDNDAANERIIIGAASPTITTTPSPVTVTLGATPVTLTDSATLAGGYAPSGIITFTLFHNGGATPVDTEVVNVTGNGTYGTPAGFTLPITGSVTGTYQWDATYNGDSNNSAVSDNNAADEQVTVSAADPTLTTTPTPAMVTLGTTAVTLTDTAVLADGLSPTGIIIFTLFQNGGTTPVDTESVTVNGNGTYTTPAGFALPGTGTVIGNYQWNATYNGDASNNAVSDNNAADEQVTVSAADPTLTTTPTPATVTLGTTAVTLTDAAVLADGFNPTGIIIFTLFHISGTMPVDTEIVRVNGNGTYATPTGFTLPTTGTATGIYQWDAVYSGDTNNSAVSDNNAADEQVSVSAADPTLTTTPTPATVTLGTTPVTLTDSATLAGGFSPTGAITFRLFHNGGVMPVDTETVTVNGNGTYTTPTGFTLPTTGTVTGTYQWDATYGGDTNNSAISDDNAVDEQVTVQAASPTLGTTPNPTTVTLGANAVTLTDTATLESGFHPTGTITFTLFHNGGPTPVDTETVTVNGNGPYTTTSGFPLPATGTATGMYQWDATYSGDANNNTASDTGSVAEQVMVNIAGPTLSTTPNPTTVTLGATPVTLADSATLAGGFSPTGTITFTLLHDGGATPVDTETVAVTGNGTYKTPTGFTLPTTGTVTGTYQWDAVYSGDPNNNVASDNNSTDEQATVSAANPTLTTTPTPATVTLGATPVTLTDSATLARGYAPTGAITFRLFHNGGATPVVTEVVTVNGNGTYKTPTGFTLPTTGIVQGTYQWDATYSGDPNNNVASDNNATDEQVTVGAANPTLTTIPTPAMGILGGTLQDTAELAGGFDPTGSITFRLYAPGVDPTAGPATYTEIVSGVGGNGMYKTTRGFAANATGTWHWVATYDGDSDNGSASTGPLDEPATIVGQVDLLLTKTVNDSTPSVGDTITYTVALTNKGPDTATGVQVDDLLPAGLLLVSAAPSEGTYDASTGLWNVGTVNVGSLETLVIFAKVVSFETQTNVAMVAHSNEFDSNSSDNAASVVVSPIGAPPPFVTFLQRFGFHAQPTQYVLTFNSQLDPAPAQNIQNYTLAPIGPRGHLGKKIRIVSAIYDPLTLTVTIHPATRVYLFQRYQLAVNGTAPDGLANPSGTLLDGQGNGKPGTDYVKVFGPSILAGPYPGFSAKGVHQVRHSRPAPAHSMTKVPATARHSSLSAAQTERIGATEARSSHDRPSTKAVDAVLATMTTPHRSKNVHR
jgi:hypothetical protein